MNELNERSLCPPAPPIPLMLEGGVPFMLLPLVTAAVLLKLVSFTEELKVLQNKKTFIIKICLLLNQAFLDAFPAPWNLQSADFLSFYLEF